MGQNNGFFALAFGQTPEYLRRELPCLEARVIENENKDESKNSCNGKTDCKTTETGRTGAKEEGYSFQEHQNFHQRIVKEYTSISCRDTARWLQLDRRIAHHLGVAPKGAAKELYEWLSYVGINLYELSLRRELEKKKGHIERLREDIGEKIKLLEGERRDGLSYQLSSTISLIREQSHNYRGGELLVAGYCQRISSLDAAIERAKTELPKGKEKVKGFEQERSRISEEKRKTEEAQEDLGLEIQKRYQQIARLENDVRRLKLETRISKRVLINHEAAVGLLTGYLEKKDGLMRSSQLYVSLERMDRQNGNMALAAVEVNSFLGDEMQTLANLGIGEAEEEKQNNAGFSDKIDSASEKEHQKNKERVEKILNIMGL